MDRGFWLQIRKGEKIHNASSNRLAAQAEMLSDGRPFTFINWRDYSFGKVVALATYLPLGSGLRTQL